MSKLLKKQISFIFGIGIFCFIAFLIFTNISFAFYQNADANSDGTVDGLDYVVWLLNYEKSNSGKDKGDFNGDNTVDGLDYLVWLNSYGNTAGKNIVNIGLGGYAPLENYSKNGTNGTGAKLTEELGIDYTMTSVDWNRYEPTQNTFSETAFGGSDAQILGCNNYFGNGNCRIMLGTSPSWAETKSTQKLGSYCPHAPINTDSSTINSFKNFVKKVVERYDGDGINDKLTKDGKPLLANTFLLINEMDYMRSNCGQAPWNTELDLNQNQKPDWQDYADFLKIFYQTVKEANPSTKVSFGTYGNFEIHDQIYGSKYKNQDSQTFIYRVLNYLKNNDNLNMFPYFDIMNIHYYELYHCNNPYTKFDSYSDGGIRGSVRWFNNVLSQFNLKLPIIISEISNPVPLVPNSHEEDIMAENLTKILTQSQSMLPEGIINVGWYDLGFGDSQYGLIDKTTTGVDKRKRPAFFAYKKLYHELQNFEYKSIDESSVNLEGYLFQKNNDKKEVLWSVPTRGTFCPAPYPWNNNLGLDWGKASETWPAPTVIKTFISSSITVSDHLGTQTITINDGSSQDLDKKINGQIQITVTSKPLIVSY